VRLFSTACDSVLFTSIVSKWRPFGFIFNQGNRKVGWVRDDSQVGSGQNSLVKKKVWDSALSWCNSQFLVAKVRAEVFAHLHAVAIKVTVVCEIDCLACQDEFLVNKDLDVKETDEHALDSAFTAHP
jgi:hypothetical protein